MCVFEREAIAEKGQLDSRYFLCQKALKHQTNRTPCNFDFTTGKQNQVIYNSVYATFV